MEQTLLNIYTEKLKKPVDELFKKLMNETWFSASEAIEYGIAQDIYFGKYEFKPLNVAIFSKINEDNLKTILNTKLIKEFNKMNDKIKAELAKIKAEIQAMDAATEELLKEDQPTAEMDEEIKNEVTEDEKPEEMPVAEEDMEPKPEEAPMAEEMTEGLPAVIEKELISEIVEILSDETGAVAGEDLMEILEIKDPMAALKAAAVMGKARRMLNQKVLNKTLTTSKTINSNAKFKNAVKTETVYNDKRIDFTRIPKSDK
jgi:replicative superfamily II helicase